MTISQHNENIKKYIERPYLMYISTIAKIFLFLADGFFFHLYHANILKKKVYYSSFTKQ